ncbi:MAG: cation:proton antiporter [bacterium]
MNYLNEILFSVLLLVIFFVSAYLKTSFVLISVMMGTFVSLIYNFYGIQFKLGAVEIFSELAIALIFFSLGLGYNVESFFKIIKKSFIGSLIDLLNFTTPFLLVYLVTKDLFLSFIISLCLYPSSTAIVIKILEFQKKLAGKLADLIIGILIFEDIFLIISLSFLSFFLFNESQTKISSFLYLPIILSLIFLISKTILTRYSNLIDKYLQEEIGIFFALGYFLLIFYICKIFHLPELLIVFLSALSIPKSTSNYVKNKIEHLKNFSIGVFILGFILETKIGQFSISQISNYTILLALPFFVVLKILTLNLALKNAGIKYKKEDNLLLVGRGEFSAYIAKIANIDLIAFISIFISNFLVFFLFLNKRKQKN